MNSQRFKIVLILFFTSVLMISCEKDCFEKSGSDTTKIIELEPYSKLIIHNNFNVSFIQDTLCFVEVKAKENLIKNIIADVKDSTLCLSDKNTCTFIKGYHEIKTIVHFTNLNSIFIDGSPSLYSKDSLFLDRLLFVHKGDVITSDLKINARKLEIQLHAIVGELKISGIVDDLYLYSSGTNHCFCKDLICKKAAVNHSDIGDVYLSVIDKLNLAINASGDFYCYKNPLDTSITTKDKCTGKVFFKD